MSFADRLKKFTAMDLTASAPRGPVGLCHPQMVAMRGYPMGLVHMELAPMLVGGAESTRILQAFLELFDEIARSGSTHESARELDEAVEHLREHLKSVSAAADLAHAEHQSLKHAAKGTLQ